MLLFVAAVTLEQGGSPALTPASSIGDGQSIAEHAKEDESVGARSLSQLFRNRFEFQNRLRNGMLAPSDGKTCAASCHQLSPRGHFRSRLVYVHKSSGGLSDRAWTIAHLLAVANSLCARLQLRAPYQLLTPMHNNGIELKSRWTWDRYFDWGDQAQEGGTGAPLRLDDESLVPGNKGDCPAPVPGTPFLGPSDQIASTTQDMAAARASKTPFDWCLNYFFRPYIGSDGFESPESKQNWPTGVPHEWCDMSSAWLSGSEDVASEQHNEFSLGPSGLVRGKALDVTKSLGLVLPNINGYQARNVPESTVTPARSMNRLTKPSGTCPPICFTRANGAWYTKCGDRSERCKDCTECSTLRANSTTPRKDGAVQLEQLALPREHAAPHADWEWPWDSMRGGEQALPSLSPMASDTWLYALHVRRSDTVYQCDTSVPQQVYDGSARHLVPLALPSAFAFRALARRAF